MRSTNAWKQVLASLTLELFRRTNPHRKLPGREKRLSFGRARSAARKRVLHCCQHQGTCYLLFVLRVFVAVFHHNAGKIAYGGLVGNTCGEPGGILVSGHHRPINDAGNVVHTAGEFNRVPLLRGFQNGDVTALRNQLVAGRTVVQILALLSEYRHDED
jgi:hypothetical protein